jgi:hypothetical protein
VRATQAERDSVELLLALNEDMDLNELAAIMNRLIADRQAQHPTT